MKHKLLQDNEERTFILAFEEGDQFMPQLRDFAEEENLTAAEFTAIGALREATLAFFDPEKKDYEEIPVEEQTEVLTLTGNVAVLVKGDTREPKIHAHAVLGKRDGTTVGGHLMQATVRPTLEVMLTESPSFMERKADEKTGLDLLQP